MEVIGRRCWASAEGYIPGWSHGDKPEMTSHEALCVLNQNEHEALLEMLIYYEDRDPVGPYRLKVPARRCKHFRINDFKSPEPVPTATPFSWTLRSNIPVIVQHTRLDSRQAENALMSTIPFSSV